MICEHVTQAQSCRGTHSIPSKVLISQIVRFSSPKKKERKRRRRIVITRGKLVTFRVHLTYTQLKRFKFKPQVLNGEN
jgi:hypothetical protein